ncbi:MAG: hypothetical protein SPL06_04530 [Bacteroidales bacterium]|nr:hypothetical protein [Bacteroidales bacterium]
MQNRVYQRIQLTMDAVFEKDGTVTPKRIICDDQVFDIARILDVCRHYPTGVSCVAPIQYTVKVEGQERKIYFEPDSNTWFSVKEVVMAK